MDELNFTVLLSNELAEMATNFSPHHNVPALDITKVSGNLNLMKTSSVTISNYLSIKETEDRNCPIGNMLETM